MRDHGWAALVLSAVMGVGCGGGGSTPAAPRSTASAASAASSTTDGAVRGRVADATSGWAYLIASDAGARTLPALAATVRDTVAIDPEGRFAFPAADGADRVVLSVPGRALTSVALARRADLDGVALAPEASVACAVVDGAGAPEEDALALVLDDAGHVLPLPPADLVARADGRLTARRLPAGRYELLVASGDSRRHARASVTVAAGEARRLEVVLRPDDRLAVRFLRVTGAPWPPAGLEEGTR